MRKETQQTLEALITRTLDPKGGTDQHAMTLYSMILQNRATNILELGVRTGRTTYPLCMGARMMEGKMTSVDINEPTVNLNTVTENYKKFSFVKSDAHSFLKRKVADGEYYDFIYVDDWHDGLHVQEELEYIYDLTDKKSLIVLHDAMAGTYPDYYHGTPDGEFGNGGVTGALDNLDFAEWEFCTIPVSHGLTILRRLA
jgi:predicted O-methyltransferase YrrM